MGIKHLDFWHIAVQFIMIKILSKLDNIVKYSKNVGTVYISAYYRTASGVVIWSDDISSNRNQPAGIYVWIV